MAESRYCFLCGWLAPDLCEATPLDAGANHSAVRPPLNALVVPPGTLPNAHPHLGRSLRLYLSLNRRPTLRTKKILIRVLLDVLFGRDMSRPVFWHPGGKP
jgi:hypothetical protein